ncbi:BREX-1 system adenine-specific DNA-methyltransferase PglX [Collinsella aerofaciens]|uniref:BREX-1 system adenine-specific DNA-methyltransferase PglX n=1 Tax=Collinsella aerofaciens TaxID=74426 RepID=UPI001260B7A6|nr:BREX-1 system adenine-specific DNA-methyltransferase PglX [Collinsella aerofaciens]VWL63784.1 Methyltransferase domain protein [Collinsella aerofaciens]
MDTKELEKFCPWARIRLIDEVRQRCYAYGLDDAGREEFDRDATIVKGTVLSALERSQRSELYGRIEHDGYAHFCEEMAYTWFNRFAAIRYMEVRGYLPCGVRMLSSYCETSEYDSFSPDCLRMPTELDLPGLERDRVFDLVAAADDEALFRLIVVAQMNELAECLPAIFGRVGTADALLLPTRLLDRGEEGVLCALVERVKRRTWENVESLGWMYQFYNSEVKDAFFKSKAKETPDTIGPATQLFTPNWIVRYMVQNSLGRLWMLNNSESPLRDEMEYYIEPDAEHEDFIKIESPEDISLCDPACGSGHILVYAFELLAKMYLEREYRMRDIPGLILSKNLHGMEIDPRAAQIAGLALAICAREMDRRFFGRGVQADVAVLEPVMLEEDDIPHGAVLAKKKDLIDALTHLGEVGSLLAPSEGDLAALREAIELIGTDGLFDGSSKNKLVCALKACEILARRHDCVVANPPYMGSSSFGPFMSKWVKKNYSDVKSDLCTCFIERGFNLAKDRGYSAMVTMASWMFLSSFEAMRRRVLDSKSIVSMCYMGHMVMRIAFNTSATVFANCRTNSLGSYCRIEAKDLDAAGNPVSFPAGETEFYRRDAETFKQIPGTPIAYWLSEKYGHMFEPGTMKSAYVSGGRLKTHDNEKYVRNWWEVPASLIGRLWMPLSNGGGFSRWSGMKYDVVNWSDEANDFYDQHGGLPKSGSIERKGICWGLITSGRCSFRVKDQGELFTSGAPTVFMSNQDSERALSIDLAFLNSSIASELLDAINPTLNTTVGDVLSLPMPPSSALDTEVVDYADQSVSIADADWDSFETSWDFKRHPLV